MNLSKADIETIRTHSAYIDLISYADGEWFLSGKTDKGKILQVSHPVFEKAVKLLMQEWVAAGYIPLIRR